MNSNKILVPSENWEQRIGEQRDWIWRGWQTRYSFRRAARGGTQAPLLLVHGFGAAIEHWRKNIPVLSDRRAVYALDLLGFGASRKVGVDYGMDVWGEQLYDFWRAFVGEPLVLVGNSVGSLACLTAAARHPEMVAGLVLLNVPDVSLRQAALPAWLAPMVTGLENAIASPPVLELLLRVLRRPNNIRRWAGVAYEDRAAIDEELVAILSRPAYDEGAGEAFAALFRSVRQPNFAPSAIALLPKIEIPILLMWGTRDRMVPFQLAEAFLKLNPRLEFIELEGAGHCPHDECPERFNRVLLDWLVRNSL